MAHDIFFARQRSTSLYGPTTSRTTSPPPRVLTPPSSILLSSSDHSQSASSALPASRSYSPLSNIPHSTDLLSLPSLSTINRPANTSKPSWFAVLSFLVAIPIPSLSKLSATHLAYPPAIEFSQNFPSERAASRSKIRSVEKMFTSFSREVVKSTTTSLIFAS